MLDLQAMIRNGESDAPLQVTSFMMADGMVGYRVAETSPVKENVTVEIRDEDGTRRMTVYDTAFTASVVVKGESLKLEFRS